MVRKVERHDKGPLEADSHVDQEERGEVMDNLVVAVGSRGDDYGT
jgi:hypothetical protein